MELTSVFKEMVMLLLLVLVGFTAQKMWKAGAEVNRVLAKVTMEVLSPCLILSSALQTDAEMTALELLIFVGCTAISLVIVFALSVASVGVMRLKDNAAATSQFAILFGNAGYFGFPIIAILYGVNGLFYSAVFHLIYAIAPYTLGVAILSGGKGVKFDPKVFLTAPVFSSMLAIAVFLLKINIPPVVSDAIGTLGSAAIPISMLMVGISMAGMNFREAFGDWRVYVISLVRLAVVPLAVWFVLHFLMSNKEQLGALVVLCSMPAAVMTVMLSVQYGRDEKIGAKIVLVSTLMSAFSIPMLFYALT